MLLKMIFQVHMKLMFFQLFILCLKITKRIHANMMSVDVLLAYFNKFLFSFFQGGREVSEFIKYLAKEATEPLNGYNRDGSKKKITDGEL